MQSPVRRPPRLECRAEALAFADEDPALEEKARDWWRSVDRERGTEPNVTGPRHLVSLFRPVHALARRAVVFVDQSSQPSRVSNVRIALLYQDALVMLCEQVTSAIKTGSITPRDDRVGLRIATAAPPEFEQWRRIRDAVGLTDSSEAKSRLLTAALSETTDLFPGVLVDPVQFSTWAVTEGIAVPSEVERLLANCVPDDARQSPSDPRHQDASWKVAAKAYADEIYQRDKAMGCEPSKESIARDIAKRFDEEGIRGRNGRLDEAYIRRHALTDWQKPHRRF